MYIYRIPNIFSYCSYCPRKNILAWSFFFTHALIDKKWSKIDGTLKKPQRPNSIRFLNFYTPNFIPDENKHEINIEKTYIWRPGRQMSDFHTHVLDLGSAGILTKLHPITWNEFLRYFLVSSSNTSKTPFLEHLCTMAS